MTRPLVSLAVTRNTRYTGLMFNAQLDRRLLKSVRMTAALFALAGLCGCATLTFKSTRSTRFINMDGQIVCVDYGKEKRTETLPNGLVCTFEGKVRLQLPEGKRIVLYHTMSTSGVRYASADKRYAFIEMGPYCIVSQKGKPIFEGFFCRK